MKGLAPVQKARAGGCSTKAVAFGRRQVRVEQVVEGSYFLGVEDVFEHQIALHVEEVLQRFKVVHGIFLRDRSRPLHLKSHQVARVLAELHGNQVDWLTQGAVLVRVVLLFQLRHCRASGSHLYYLELE